MYCGIIRNMLERKIIIANWKMNPQSLKEAERLFNGIVKSVYGIRKTQIIICPPFLYLEKLEKLSKKIFLGAQNIFWKKDGAYTGEISGDMLYNIGVRYIIVGHSERRAMGENNQDINKKIKASITAGLRPILCVGESIRDKNHKYLNFIKTQIEECLKIGRASCRERV